VDIVKHGRPCPVCGGTKSKLLYEQRFDGISGAKLLDGYDIVICTACGAGFADGIPEQSVFDEYYRELSKYEGDGPGESAPPIESRMEQLAELVSRFIPRRDARILEIGCGYGQLLWLLRQRGFTNVLGADPSPGCVRAGHRFYGVQMIASTVFDVPEPPETYDFLVLSGVMEHIRDLDLTVEKFHRLLGPEGRVCLQVPDASRYAAGLDAPFQEFSTEHINYFSPGSMKNLMTRRGFRVVESGRAIGALHEASVPVAWGIYERSSVSTPLEPDTETEAGLTTYIEGCRAQDSEVRAKIRRALPADGRIIVWGVGAHTLRLLATGGLEPQWIAAFVDSNAKYQQRELRGIPVIPPDAVCTRHEPILISSKGFQNDIHDQITRRMGLPNRVILLYDVNAASA